jgi:hypothetical protein
MPDCIIFEMHWSLIVPNHHILVMHRNHIVMYCINFAMHWSVIILHRKTLTMHRIFFVIHWIFFHFFIVKK